MPTDPEWESLAREAVGAIREIKVEKKYVKQWGYIYSCPSCHVASRISDNAEPWELLPNVEHIKACKAARVLRMAEEAGI